MLHQDLSGKKLLLLGGTGATVDLAELAHRNHVFLGVAGCHPGAVVKELADCAHDVNALDVDAIARLYRAEHYDGILSNSSDIFSLYAAKIAQQVGAYSPFDAGQLRMSTDKKYFKDTCKRFGVPVPREYPISDEEAVDTADILYPVIVKPVDNGGSKGITVCRNAAELKKGIATAKAFSRCGRFLVEEYLDADEINVTYLCQDGEIRLAAIHDRYFNTSQEGVLRVPDLYIYPSRYTGRYLEQYDPLVLRMLKGIGLKNGSLFMQACVKDGKVYFYEAGMRLNGCKTYQILEVENDYNTLEHLMLYALTGSMGERVDFSPKFRSWYATWNLVGRPGAVCQSFVGKRELESYPWLIHAATRFQQGERIPESARGTLGQLAGRFHVYGSTKEQLLERIDRMQTLFRIEDPAGQNVLLPPHEIGDIRRRLDYELF